MEHDSRYSHVSVLIYGQPIYSLACIHWQFYQ